MAEDRIVELNLVVRIKRQLDGDLELIIKEALADEGIVVQETIRPGMTGTIDLPVLWMPTEVEKKKPPPPPKPSWTPPWRRKR